MAISKDEKKLRTEARTAILEGIKTKAPTAANGDELKDLAEAFALLSNADEPSLEYEGDGAPNIF